MIPHSLSTSAISTRGKLRRCWQDISLRSLKRDFHGLQVMISKVSWDLPTKIVSAVTELTGDDEFDGLSVDQRAEQLLAVANMQNNADTMKRRITMTRPETSLASSSLFKSNAIVFSPYFNFNV